MRRIHARWILPVSAPPIANGTLVEDGGRIVSVGPRITPDSDDIDLGDAILLPGLVNTHCHLELTAMRGFLDGLGFREWILRLTFARRAVLTGEMMLDSARLGVAEGVLHGITTFADTGDSGAGFDAMLSAGVRGICYREVFGPDPAQSAESAAGLEERIAGMLPRATTLVRVGVSPHAPYTVSDPLFAAVAEIARARGLPLAVHIAESELEQRLVVDGEGAFADGLRRRDIGVTARARSPIALLGRLGVLDTKPLLIHCVRVDAADIADIATHDCAVAHCPASNAKFGHGIAPLAALLAAGIRVGIGTDSVASNDRMDVLDEARLAALFSNARERGHSALPASRALELATLGGARALGLGDAIGSLEAGKSADLAAFALPHHRAPLHDPVASAVFAVAGQPASLVMVAGRVLARNGALVAHDPGLSSRVQASADALQAWGAAQS